MGRKPKQNLPKDLTALLQKVGAHVHYFRLKKHITQLQLSDKSGISVTTINEIEARRCRDIRLSTLSALSRALNISVLELMNGPQVQMDKQDKQSLLRASEDFLKALKQYVPTES